MKNTSYQRKGAFFKEQGETYKNTRDYLYLLFYLLALLAIYTLFQKNMNLYLKLILSLFILGYPYYIFYFEKITVIAYNYLYAFIVVQPVKKKSI